MAAKERTRFRDLIPEVENLADMIFGLALSIGSLILVSTPPTSSRQILEDVIAFAYGFIILVAIWQAFSQHMLVIKVETKGLLWATYLMLFLVAIEPYLFNLITAPPPTATSVEKIDELASMLYATDLAGLMFALAFFSRAVMNQERVEDELRRLFRGRRNAYLLAGAGFVISMLPFFWSISISVSIFDLRLRFLIWIVAPLLILTNRLIRGRRRRLG
ncbi:MAG TPA: hypothetical protein VMB46_01965 [Methanomassiliicoccales archaeon]|nr:hypothetical protein [Methanomassiliicoccales archaeon]